MITRRAVWVKFETGGGSGESGRRIRLRKCLFEVQEYFPLERLVVKFYRNSFYTNAQDLTTSLPNKYIPSGKVHWKERRLQKKIPTDQNLFDISMEILQNSDDVYDTLLATSDIESASA